MWMFCACIPVDETIVLSFVAADCPSLRERRNVVYVAEGMGTDCGTNRGVSNRSSSAQFSSFGALIECTSANDNDGI